MLAGLAPVVAGAEIPPAQLALSLEAEGQRSAAAVEYRRLALSADEPDEAAGWLWFAAHQYALANDRELSNTLLDRAEDAEPFALSFPVSWLRAENALGQRDWPSAAFHFDSLRFKAAADELRDFAARGAAVAHLREGDIPAADRALAAAPAEPTAARAALDRYAAGRDKKPWLGGLLGLVPGLGYAYSGEYANAARSLILNSLFIWGMVEAAESEEWGIFAVVTFGEITWYTGSIYGGVDAAHRHNRGRLEQAVSDIRGSARLHPDPAQAPLVTLQFDF